MSRARDLSKLGNPNVIKADENSVGFGTQVAGNHANADSSLISAGIITATAYYGDGSNLEGVASAGLGTAVDDTKDSIGQNIYFTNQELSINENTTVNAPDTSSIAYTQYQQVTVESGSELIIADGDSFIPDVLGIGTALQASTAGAGNGLFGTVYADNIENAAGRGGPNFPLGITVAGVSTLGGNVSIGGTLTYEDVTNVDSIGVVTARSGIDITSGGLDITAGGATVTAGGITVGSGGINVTGDSTFAGVLSLAGGADGTLQELRLAQGNASQKLATIKGHSANTNEKGIQFNTFHYTPKIPMKIASTGAIGLGGDNYGTAGQVLTTQGSGDVAQWATPSAGAWSKLSSGLFDSGNALEEVTTTHLTSSHQLYRLNYNCETSPSSGESALVIEIQIGGTWRQDTNYYYGWNNGGSGTANESSKPNFLLGKMGRRFQGEVTFMTPYDTTRVKQFASICSSTNSNTSYSEGLPTRTVGAYWGSGSTGAVTGIRFRSVNSAMTSDGYNFSAGYYILEGCAIS